MKQRLYLINKETGYIITCKDKNEYATILHSLNDYWKPCKIELVDLNEPQEPLIKDEKNRKAVRAWANAIKANALYYKGQGYSGKYCWFRYGDYEIDFPEKFNNLSDRSYTITELCGVEEL